MTDPAPCHADTAYLSVMLFGRAEKVVDAKEKTAALQKLVEKYMPGFYKQILSPEYVGRYRSSMDGNAVAVYRIRPDQLTAKENAAPREKIFSDQK